MNYKRKRKRYNENTNYNIDQKKKKSKKLNKNDEQLLKNYLKNNIKIIDGNIKITPSLENKFNLIYPMDVEYFTDVDYHDKEYIKFEKRFTRRIGSDYKEYHKKHDVIRAFYADKFGRCEICNTQDYKLIVEHGHDKKSKKKNPGGIFRVMACRSCNRIESEAKKYKIIWERYLYWLTKLWKKGRYIHPEYLYKFLKENHYLTNGIFS